MASIIKASINLTNVPKDRIIVGKKGKYLPITITLNDELDQFGNQGPVVVEQTKEEREAKAAKTYAFVRRRGYVIPEDVRAVCMDVLRHRVGLTYEAEAENITTEDIINDIMNAVEIP